MGRRPGQPSSTLGSFFSWAHGLHMFVMVGIIALMSWLIPTLLVKVADSEVIDPRDLSGTARWVIEHRALMPLMALPILAFGVAAMKNPRGRWVWLSLELLSMFVPAVLLVYVFIATIGLLYQPHDLLR